MKIETVGRFPSVADYEAFCMADRELFVREKIRALKDELPLEEQDFFTILFSDRCARPGEEAGDFLAFWQDYCLKDCSLREKLPRILVDFCGLDFSALEYDYFAWWRRCACRDVFLAGAERGGVADPEAFYKKVCDVFDSDDSRVKRSFILWDKLGRDDPENFLKMMDGVFLNHSKASPEQEGRMRSAREARELGGVSREGASPVSRRKL